LILRLYGSFLTFLRTCFYFKYDYNSQYQKNLKEGGYKMRIAVATEDGYVAQHFGRCPKFTILEVKDGQIVNQSVLENPGYRTHQPGLVPTFLRNQGVDCVIAGGMGPNAVNMLESFGIKVILGVTGKVEEVMKAFISGSLEGGESLCDHGEHECQH